MTDVWGSVGVLLLAAIFAVIGVLALRYGRVRREENAALLERVAVARRRLGVDLIPDVKERRTQQLMRGARPAMDAPPVSDADAYLAAYADAYPDTTDDPEPER
jgi:hypothetical protein